MSTNLNVRRQDQKLNCATCRAPGNGLGCVFHRQVVAGHYIPLAGMRFDRVEGDLAVYTAR